MGSGYSITLGEYRRKEGNKVKERQARDDLRLLERTAISVERARDGPLGTYASGEWAGNPPLPLFCRIWRIECGLLEQDTAAVGKSRR